MFSLIFSIGAERMAMSQTDAHLAPLDHQTKIDLSHMLYKMLCKHSKTLT